METNFKSDIEAISSEDIEAIIQEVKVADGEREKHLINHERWFKKRFGIRPATMNFPWPNSSNLHMPLTDKSIRRAKPNFYNVIAGVDPIVTFKPTSGKDDEVLVKGVERKFHDLITQDMQVFHPLAFGIDRMFERGYFTVKVIQEFTPHLHKEEIIIRELPTAQQDFLMDPETTDDDIAAEISRRYDFDLEDQEDVAEIRKVIEQIRSGSPVIKFERLLNLTPHPSLYIRDSANLIVPHNTTLIEEASWIEDHILMSPKDIEARADSGKWDKKNAYALLDKYSDYGARRDMIRTGAIASAKRDLDRLEEEREGIQPTDRKQPEISEIYMWHKWPGDRLPSPSVLTINMENTDLPLRFIKYPYVDIFGRPAKWPFVQVMSEIVSDRYYSPRGYPQILDSLQTVITNNHNAKQNYMTIANSLNFKAKRNSNVQTSWIPGQPLWVNRMDDIEEFQFSQRDLSFDNEERSLTAWAEQYIGIVDFTLMQPSGQGGGGEARTKAEIDSVMAMQVQVSGTDLQVFQHCMNKVYRMIWERFMQYGPEKIDYIGKSGEVLYVDKEDLKLKNGKPRFTFFPTGNIGNSSRVLRAQKAAQRLQFLSNNPNINQYELVADWLMNDDERVANRLLIEPQDMQQSQIERQIFEIGLIRDGYTSIPKPSDMNELHIQVIDDYMSDPAKRRNFPTDRLPQLIAHRDAHIEAIKQKQRASTKGGREQQEVANIASGMKGREARE